HAFYPRADGTLSEAEVLAAFVVQFYQDRTPPREILLSHPVEERALLAEALYIRAKHKVVVSAPQRGEKRQLVEHALVNAREALGRRLSETASQHKLLEGFAETFGLAEPPRRIEVYDNSHIQGANAVGAMIVAGREGLSKKHYRTFNIKSEALTPGDDFAMMREVLTRRFTRLMAEGGDDAGDDPDAMPDWPDVLLVDGGKGQLSAVRGVLDAMSVPRQVAVVGIAKGVDRDAGRESFHMGGRQPFMLPARDPVLYYVQRLRDEAHRFAIGSHRARRKKAIARNPLDEIEGVGPIRKRQLLNHFGSAKAVSRAALADLVAIPGISTGTAKRIYDHFNRD
ncbi:MAG TPA: excinuclease ABC subunit UvrC, partial [Devosiaceae bacterium]|nr:excinuclease ABC subunit UvrC [Devosiaceae bacterium]